MYGVARAKIPDVSTNRSGAGDPARTLELLWRQPGTRRSTRGPRQGLTIDAIVARAIVLADRDGLDALTMRRLAQALGVAPMTLYTYVPGRAELLDLMLDDVYARMPRADLSGAPWRARVTAVAGENLALFRAHPWAAVISTARPPLGPGMLAKYEHELRAFDDTGLDDVTRDAALTFLLGFVQFSARAAAEVAAQRRESAMSEQAWWAAHQPLLASVLDETRYPTAVRVGAAAGAAHGAAFDPEYAYEFGLRQILDSFDLLITRANATPPR